MKKTLILILCLCYAVVMLGQNQKTKQKVYLKDGTEIIGYVAAQPDGSYVVQNESGDMFYYTGAEIKKIIEIDNSKVRTVEKRQSGYEGAAPSKEYKKKGYMGMVSGHIGSALGVSIINGYRFSPHFYLGLETGIGFDIPLETPQMPTINLYLMSEFSKKRVAMFADLSGGLYCDIWDGIFDPQAALTLGVRNRFRKNPNHAMWWGLTLGIRQDTYKWEETYYDDSDEFGYGGTYSEHCIDQTLSAFLSAKIAFSF